MIQGKKWRFRLVCAVLTTVLLTLPAMATENQTAYQPHSLRNRVFAASLTNVVKAEPMEWLRIDIGETYSKYEEFVYFVNAPATLTWDDSMYLKLVTRQLLDQDQREIPGFKIEMPNDNPLSFPQGPQAGFYTFYEPGLYQVQMVSGEGFRVGTIYVGDWTDGAPIESTAPITKSKVSFIEDAAIFEIDNTNLSHALVRGLGVMGGDQSGNLNWDQTLTRVEAAAMLVRLTGLEEEALASMGKPIPFSDVPDWAHGYVALAYEHQLVQGVGNGQFGSNQTCTAQEFITMLYRLTDLQEDVDYSWSTAIEDIISDLRALESIRTNEKDLTGPQNMYQYTQLWQNYGSALEQPDFTRELAAATIFRMMSITAGPEEYSLADKLAYEYGLSDSVLYDCCVRRTSWEMSREGYTPPIKGEKPVTYIIKDEKLYVSDPGNIVIDIEIYDLSTPNSLSVPFSPDAPFTLPKKDCELDISYMEDGMSMFDLVSIRWKGGQPFLQICDVGRDIHDLYYAVRSDDFHQRIRTHYANNSQYSDTLTDEMRAIVADLIQDKHSERDKAMAICDWVSSHIFYDYDAYLDGIRCQDPIMVSRRGVCGDFAALTNDLLRAAELESYVELTNNHAWNLAFLDGEWVLMDNTWDSSLVYRFGMYQSSGGVVWINDPSLQDATPVSNKMEPGIPGRGEHFGLPDLYFYTMDSHAPRRLPALYDTHS